MTTASPILRGIVAALVSTGSFVANDTCMKLALSDAPAFQVLVMRGVSSCLWCLPILIIMGHGRQLPEAFHLWVVLRSLCEAFAILCFIIALSHMPIADVTALVQITPLLVLVGIWLFWGEKVGTLRFLLIFVGISGAILVAQPGTEAASPFAIFGFLTAVGAAGRDLATRKVPTGAPALVVTFSTLLIVLLVSCVCMLLFEVPVMPTGRHVGLMAAAGLLQMGGHLFVFLAFRIAPARTVAPFFYAFMLWAAASGYLVFGDVPNALAISGMVLILLAGLGVVLSEGRTRQGDPV
ncbi:MAG: DMT family transporter [Alphaproteobacteria bacterium]|nr:DMT family transporter [Alphaproteobacteria bacterium]